MQRWINRFYSKIKRSDCGLSCWWLMNVNATFAVNLVNAIVGAWSLPTAAAKVVVFFIPTLAHNIKLSQTFPCRRDADLKAMQVKWQLLNLRLSNVQAPVPLSAAAASRAEVKNSCHDPSSSWEIWFDGDVRRCPTFCAALLGTVLTLPSSPRRKQRAGHSETTALNTAP